MVSWEEALQERFCAYLLRSADGQERPAEAVARALTRLRAGDLQTLASLAFLLDPDGVVERLVCDALPHYLERLFPRTERIRRELRGHVRARIDWGRTIVLRQQTRDPLRALAYSLRRTFDTDELRAVRWAVELIVMAVEHLSISSAAAKTETWVQRYAAITTGVREVMRAAPLRELPCERPADAVLARLESRQDAVGFAARVIRDHERLSPGRSREALAHALGRYALMPLDQPTRFELFALVAVAEAVDRIVGDEHREDSLIAPGRHAIAVWQLPRGRVLLYYNQSAKKGRFARVMSHAYGISGTLRPDLRLVYRTKGAAIELVVDAKLSESDSYLRKSYLKMYGYLGDRPEAFHQALNPKAVLVAPRRLQREPLRGEPVVFVDPAACLPDGALDRLLRRWLESAQAALASPAHAAAPRACS